MAEKKALNLSQGNLMKRERLLTLKRELNKMFPIISWKTHLWGNTHRINLWRDVEFVSRSVLLLSFFECNRIQYP